MTLSLLRGHTADKPMLPPIRQAVRRGPRFAWGPFSSTRDFPSHVLGEGGFDAGTDRVPALLDLVQFAGGQQRERAWTADGVGALRADGTGQAGGLVELDLDVVVSADAQGPPLAAEVALGARGPAVVPVDCEDGLVRPCLAFRLVTVVGHDRAEQGNAVHLIGPFDLRGADVGGVDRVLGRDQVDRREGIVDLGGERAVLDRGDRGGRVHNHLRQF